MAKMTKSELLAKWKPILENEEFEGIDNKHKKFVTAQLLENTQDSIQEEPGPNTVLTEAAPINNTGNVQNYDPVMISLIRRSMPNLIAYDIAGVQPMTGPSGLIFAMRSNYALETANSANVAEAFYNEADTSWTGKGTHLGDPLTPADTNNSQVWSTGTQFSTAEAEALGSGAPSADFREMNFSIEKVTVEAESRALKATYSTEFAQDLKAIHNLDAEEELSGMLQGELLNEINRHLVRTVYYTAKIGSQNNTQTNGVFDLDVDANGRNMSEKFKGLMFHIEREANSIARETMRGKGNLLICSANVASALNTIGVLDYTPAVTNNLDVDITRTTFAGVMNGFVKVYVDPYATNEFMVVGYRGQNPMDAGLFYCPYVPLQYARVVNDKTFQPAIGFKTRYGMVANPFAEGLTKSKGAINANANVYYRKSLITHLM